MQKNLLNILIITILILSNAHFNKIHAFQCAPIPSINERFEKSDIVVKVQISNITQVTSDIEIAGLTSGEMFAEVVDIYKGNFVSQTVPVGDIAFLEAGENLILFLTLDSYDNTSVTTCGGYEKATNENVNKLEKLAKEPDVTENLLIKDYSEKSKKNSNNTSISRNIYLLTVGIVILGGLGIYKLYKRFK